MQAKRWKSAVLVGLAFSVFLVLSVWSDPAHSRQNDAELYQSGKNCQNQLKTSTKKQQFRIYWERCLQPFERLAEDYPDSPLVDKAFFEIGSLYEGLHRYSGLGKDLSRSRSAYQKLLNDHPLSPLVKRVRSRPKIYNPDPRATIQNVRFFDYPDYTRLVLDLDRPVTYQRAKQDDPKLIRLILSNANLGNKAQARIQSLNGELFQWIEFNSTSDNTVELNISLKQPIKTSKVIPLKSPDRLVVDLVLRPPVNLPAKPLKAALPLPPRNLVNTIIVDPGHGGKDPGAIGKRGLTEKEIVLDIALRLRKLIVPQLGIKVIMTRDRDEFISLNDRIHLANSRKADLFLSIHANAHPRRSKRGIEIYRLGRSSDKRALAVAARENSVSMEFAGMLDQSVQNILLDLNLEYKMDQSLELAHAMGESLRSALPSKQRQLMDDLRIKQAPFYVLLNSNMPGILTEISYISNPTDEKLLRKPSYRQRIAEALFKGLKSYIAEIESLS